MKHVQYYCEGCKQNRRFSVDSPSGLEDIVWFVLGLCFMGLPWIFWIGRHMGCSKSCDTCGSSKGSTPK